MNINQMLQQTGAVEAISREIGVDPATAEAGATALLPSILSGFQNPVAAADSEPAGSAFPGLGGLGARGGTQVVQLQRHDSSTSSTVTR